MIFFLLLDKEIQLFYLSLFVNISSKNCDDAINKIDDFIFKVIS